MQPCEVADRLPWWNAMPGMKNTEYGIGALSKARERCTRSLDSTRNVPTGVRYPGLPLVIGTGPYSTTPPRSSHALLWARSMQARAVAAHGTPAGLAGAAGLAGVTAGAAGTGAAGAGAAAIGAAGAAGAGRPGAAATTCAASPHTATGSARATAVTPPASTPAATASATPTTTLEPRMVPPTRPSPSDTTEDPARGGYGQDTRPGDRPTGAGAPGRPQVARR